MRVLLQILGCRLNHAEGAVIRGLLEGRGAFVEVSTLGKATARPDAFVLHTCAVTGAAQTEALRHLRAARRLGLSERIVSGCAANVTPHARLFEAGATAVVTREGVARAVDAPLDSGAAEVVFRALHHATRAAAVPSHATTRAPVKIQDGCSFRCTYCIVPDARGNPWNRPLDDLLDECRALLSRGFRELVLTGVNVACWRDGDRTFADVVHAVSALPGLARVRMSSVEPHTAEELVLTLLAERGSRLCPTLHFPLQSGSDRVLARMRRRYTANEYRDTVLRALDRVPDLGLGADVMTGFPGETEEDFAQTVRLVEELPFSNLHVFPYSERPGTPAATFPDAVPVAVRRRRARELIALGDRKREAFARSFVGHEAELLVERVSPDGVASGWTGQYLPIRVPGRTPADVGTLLRATVRAAEGDVLLA